MDRLEDIELARGERVLVQEEDLNAPLDGDGRVSSDARLIAALPTLKAASDAGARVLVMSHLGRPTEGQVEQKYSLAPVAERLAQLLGREVRLLPDWVDGVTLEDGEVALGENVRFLSGEMANDESLARRLAALCDVYVMDAFGTAHRAHASTHAVTEFAPRACAGPLLAGELDALGKALERPARPLLAIVGGAKVSTKLEVLKSLAERVDGLIVGGGIANTFIAAAGHEVGDSLYEADLVPVARELIDTFAAAGKLLPLPEDVVVSDRIDDDAEATVKAVDSVSPDDKILDIGPRTAARYADLLEGAGTIVWNGPVGVFECRPFADGTRAVALAVARSRAFSIAGGGDTLAAIETFGIDVGSDAGVSYTSTGGGAFLEYLEGKTLPAIAALEARAGRRSRSD